MSIERVPSTPRNGAAHARRPRTAGGLPANCTRRSSSLPSWWLSSTHRCSARRGRPCRHTCTTPKCHLPSATVIFTPPTCLSAGPPRPAASAFRSSTGRRCGASPQDVAQCCRLGHGNRLQIWRRRLFLTCAPRSLSSTGAIAQGLHRLTSLQPFAGAAVLGGAGCSGRERSRLPLRALLGVLLPQRAGTLDLGLLHGMHPVMRLKLTRRAASSLPRPA